MCEYCGCQQITVVAELTAEHDRLRALSRDLAAAVDHGDLDSARPLAAAMRDVLEPHTHVEESGLFPALAATFGPRIDDLVNEHHSIDAALTDLAGPDPDPGWRQRTRAALIELFNHILKEQDGVFPAAVAMLSPAEWDAVAQARAETSSGLPPTYRRVS